MVKKLALPFLAGCGALLLSACNPIYQPVGYVLSAYSQDEVVPYVLSSGDLDLSACGTGMGQHQLVASFSRVIDRPSQVLLNTNLLAGLCSEAEAFEQQLRFQRALREGDTATARDARIASQRLFRRTALRRFQVYNDTVEAFGELGDGNCPNFDSLTEETEYLIGSLTSVQAVLSDIQASSSVGVPQDVAAKVGRATDCMDNDKFWGVPNALQAVVWLSVPGAGPDNVDPWTQLDQAMALGAEKNMPLAAMLYAIAGYGQSDVEREKKGIRRVAEIYNKDEAPADFQILAEVAFAQALYLSDRIWTEETGQRTPFLAMGDFPGDDAGSSDAASDFDTGDLLD